MCIEWVCRHCRTSFPPDLSKVIVPSTNCQFPATGADTNWPLTASRRSNPEKDHIRQTNYTSLHEPSLSGFTRSMTPCSKQNLSDSKRPGSAQNAQEILPTGRKRAKRPNQIKHVPTKPTIKSLSVHTGQFIHGRTLQYTGEALRCSVGNELCNVRRSPARNYRHLRTGLPKLPTFVYTRRWVASDDNVCLVDIFCICTLIIVHAIALSLSLPLGRRTAFRSRWRHQRPFRFSGSI